MKKFISLTLLFVFLFSLCSCTNKTQAEIKILPDTQKINLEYTSDKLGFSVNILSDSEEVDVEFVRFEGENLEYIRKVECTKREFEDADYVYKDGEYLHSYHLQLSIAKANGWPVTIERAVFNVGGEEQTVEFTDPIKYQYNDKYNDRSAYMFGPVAVLGESFELNQEFSFSGMSKQEDIYIKNFYFSDFLDASELRVCVDVTETSDGNVQNEKTIELGEIDGETPYKIEAGQTYRIYCVPKFKEGADCSKYDFILCTATLEYCIEGDATVYKARFPFNSQGIYNVESAEAFISQFSED